MSKTISQESIVIQNLEEFKSIENILHKKQYIQFKCENCEEIVNRRVWRMKENNYAMKCNGCIKREKCKSKSIQEKEQCKIKKEQTCLKKYGVKNPSQNQNIKEKKKKTSLKHFGVENPSQNETVKEKKKETCFKKYGTEYTFQSEKIKEKAKQTCFERYGVESTNQLQIKKEKIKQTCFKKYGVAYPCQSKIIQEKRKQTCLEKYGVINPTQLPDHKEKIKKTCLEKYGVENPNQNKQVREKTKKTCLKKYGVENPGASKHIQNKMKQTCLRKYGVEIPSQSQVVKNKIKESWSKKTLQERLQIRSKASKKYVYENQFFDSSWELAVWIWALENGKEIKREPVNFMYEFEGKEHLYFPDFEIDTQLIEIKGPQFFKKGGYMCNPFDHSKDVLFEAKHQCALTHGVKFWGEKEMKPILEYIKSEHGKDYLSQYKNN